MVAEERNAISECQDWATSLGHKLPHKWACINSGVEAKKEISQSYALENTHLLLPPRQLSGIFTTHVKSIHLHMAA